MTFDEYQEKAMRTAGHFDVTKLTQTNYELLYAAVAICGEAGELADAIKKLVFHNVPIPPEKLLDESGDVLWGLTKLSETLKSTMELVAQRNNAKLAARYPQGFVEGGGNR